jgi:hypothetical protein
MSIELNTLRTVSAGADAGLGMRETIRKCNRLYWMGAREAARVSPQYAEAAFGVAQDTAQWLATAPLDEVLDLAEAPVVTFRAGIAPTAIAPADAPRELKHLHMALRAAGPSR